MTHFYRLSFGTSSVFRHILLISLSLRSNRGGCLDGWVFHCLLICYQVG